MASNQQFSLKWTNYTSHITNAFDSLRSKEDFCDVTLSCEGRKIRAHKVLLSACSTYFKEIFKENPCQHPVIIFKNVKYDDLFAIVVYMYQGEVNIEQDALPSFLQTAEMLTVQGLTEDDDATPKSSLAQAASMAQSHAIKKDKIHPITQTITVSKQQPISIITAPSATPLNQIIYSAITHAAPSQTPVIPETIPIKRKRVASVAQTESYTENIPQQNISEVQTTDTETDEYLKSETEMDLSEYVSDAKQYRDDDEENEQIEIYEPSGEEDEKGRIFTTTISDPKTPTSGQGNAASDLLIPLPVILENDLKCATCDRTFTSISARRRHMLSRHAKIDELATCRDCSKQFKTKWSLATHVSRFHRNQ